MITDQDIKKLSGVFTTKEDLDRFATKDDVHNIIKSAVSPVQSHIIAFDHRLVSVEQEIRGLREAVQTLSVSIDNLVKSVEDLKQEYSLVVH